MSVTIEIDSIPLEQRKKILQDLSVKTLVKKGKQKYPTAHAFDVYEIIDEDLVNVPFSYYYQQLNMGFPNKNNIFPQLIPTFNIPLLERQKGIREESLSILNDTRSLMLSLYTGYGKCNHPLTPILLWDGSIKLAKDIKIGDQLIGDDSTPRNVLSTCTGRDPMYRITQIKGDSYIVNEPHILSLKISAHRSYWWEEPHQRYTIAWFDRETMNIKHKTFSVGPVSRRPYQTQGEALIATENFQKTIDPNNILDISVKDYLKLNASTKHVLKGFKARVDFPDRPVFLDPYVLGAWLGDGASTGNIFINIDQPIIEAVKNYVESIGCRWIRLKKNGEDDIKYGIRDPTPFKTNPWMLELKRYNLIKNKHIPRSYLINNRETRLQMLAGLIDTDGYCKDPGCYEIVQKNKRLADDILYLVRSLGFSAVQKEVQKTCTNAPNGPKTGTYHMCTFSGEGIEQIPCKLSRKQAPLRQINKDALSTGIKVEALGEGDYCGFTIDGNHRYLLGDFTVTHNTMFSIYLACKIKLKTVIFAHRIIIIDQWRTSILKACGKDASIQIVTSSCKIDPDADFYIINVININKRARDDFSNCGLLIADEIHTLCTEKFSKAFSYVSPKYFIGLTATPVRSDGKDRIIELFCGPNIIYKPLRAMYNVYLIKTGFSPKKAKNSNGELDWNAVLVSQCANKQRNELIVDIVRYFIHRNILITCKRKDHAIILFNALKKYNEDVDCYMGSDKIVNYDCRILIVTYSKGSVGFDHPKLDMLLLAGDIEEGFVQTLGRVHRKEWHFPIIIDLIDKFFPLKKHSDLRCKIYEETGGQVKNLVNYFPCFDNWRKCFNTDISDINEELDVLLDI